MEGILMRDYVVLDLETPNRFNDSISSIGIVIVEEGEVVDKIYEYFINVKGTEDFGYREIILFLNEHPEVKKINSKFSRDEGLAKSIREDKIVSIPN